MDLWKTLNVSNIPPALSLGAPAGAVVRNGPILFHSILEGSFLCMKGTVSLLELQLRKDLNSPALFGGACPGLETVHSLEAGVRVMKQPQKKGKNNLNLVVTLHSPLR